MEWLILEHLKYITWFQIQGWLTITLKQEGHIPVNFPTCYINIYLISPFKWKSLLLFVHWKEYCHLVWNELVVRDRTSWGTFHEIRGVPCLDWLWHVWSKMVAQMILLDAWLFQSWDLVDSHHSPHRNSLASTLQKSHQWQSYVFSRELSFQAINTVHSQNQRARPERTRE